MKLIIFFAFLVAGSSAAIHRVPQFELAETPLQKNIISDACNAYDCLITSIGSLQSSIKNIISTVASVIGTVQDLNNQLNVCLAIGGDKPSIIDQVQQAQCFLKLINEARQTIGTVISDVRNGVQNVIDSGNAVLGCVGRA